MGPGPCVGLVYYLLTYLAPLLAPLFPTSLHISKEETTYTSCSTAVCSRQSLSCLALVSSFSFSSQQQYPPSSGSPRVRVRPPPPPPSRRSTARKRSPQPPSTQPLTTQPLAVRMEGEGGACVPLLTGRGGGAAGPRPCWPRTSGRSPPRGHPRCDGRR
jgi:hypothetical protein